MSDPTFSPDDAKALVDAVDAGKVDPKDLSDTGALAYHIAKGNVKRDDLNPEGQSIFDAIQPQDSMANHPILDTVEKTAELGGMMAGGMTGAGAGAMTSPVTGPVGPVAGAVAGAGLGYGAVKSGADALNATLGYTPTKSLSQNMVDTAKDVGEGAKNQLEGEAVGAVASKGIDAIKTAFPYVAKVLKTMPKPISNMLVNDPSIPDNYSGHPDDVSSAVKGLQDGLKALKKHASDSYQSALDTLGIGGPKTAGEAALKLTGPANLKVLPPEDIGSAYIKMIQDAQGKSDLDNLRTAATISKSINAQLKFAKAGQGITPIADDLSPTLNKVKDGVKSFLDNVSGGAALNKANEQWAAMHKVYDTLQPHLDDIGEATKWIKNVISDEGTGSATNKALLSSLDQVTGKPLFDTATKQIASQMMKAPMADSLMGKMGMMLAMMHPSRMVTIPILAGAQSPALQTKAIQGLSAAGNAIKANMPAGGAMLEGLRNSKKALEGDGETKDLMDANN